MPREKFGADFPFLKRSELLSYEELGRLAQIFVGFGVRKVRVTGGEPLLRQDLPVLIALLRASGPEIALTTNGALLAKHARALKEAGLDRITVSLDSLRDETFARMTDSKTQVATVLDGIEAAQAAGLSPVKVNAVVRKGMNDDEVVELARHFKGSGVIVRFIEYMDVGVTNGWRLDEVVSGREMIERIDSVFPIEPAEATHPGEVAQRWRYRDGSGEVGVITSVSQPFCGDCSRARLSSEGQLYTCLFSGFGTDLKGPLRAGASDEELRELVARVWSGRSDAYSEQRTSQKRRLPRVEMSHIGG